MLNLELRSGSNLASISSDFGFMLGIESCGKVIPTSIRKGVKKEGRHRSRIGKRTPGDFPGGGGSMLGEDVEGMVKTL